MVCPAVTGPARLSAFPAPLQWPDTHKPQHTLLILLAPSVTSITVLWAPRATFSAVPLPHLPFPFGWNSPVYDAPSRPRPPPPISHSVHSYRQREIMTNGLISWLFFLSSCLGLFFMLRGEKRKKEKRVKKLKLSKFCDDSTQRSVLWFDLL